MAAMPPRAGLLMLSLVVVGCQPAQPAASAKQVRPEPPASEACTTELVTGQPVRGVIFAAACVPAFAPSLLTEPDHVLIGYFRPTAAQIQTLEARLRPALELGLQKPESLARLRTDAEGRAEDSWGFRGALRAILKNFAGYRRQYVGIVARGGARRVFVNCFPEAEPDGRDDFLDWKVRWVDSVDDGDWSYWSIQYDLASGQFLDFQVNPSA
jgi:hypothetical protein